MARETRRRREKEDKKDLSELFKGDNFSVFRVFRGQKSYLELTLNFVSSIRDFRVICG